jgi:hypothetical protein
MEGGTADPLPYVSVDAPTTLAHPRKTTEAWEPNTNNGWHFCAAQPVVPAQNA